MKPLALYRWICTKCDHTIRKGGRKLGVSLKYMPHYLAVRTIRQHLKKHHPEGEVVAINLSKKKADGTKTHLLEFFRSH